ncbi:hypothetical protein PSECIP111951_01614 [Pseudoalteromonas holothuriae]|uniref:Beta-lactamase-related domain-containing protein n=1 Tax=Pseudoalteromonas holothuriae TaxID=2963714 RepID=A0A9W4QT13_9GAMM|nr:MULTISPECIES: hypothetical protein [unclassified Pseudoalteromonas]CAH9051669.1 hypothetical protein PSECIP111854_00802 [Pseudoalteromonas sp. CIP111854]CAH9057181.1 hypothetical protein PSECIP111951_01614 [Pseudoalteromonas sp. CIP111951]
MPIIGLTLFALTFISTLASANNAFIEKEINAYMKANNVPALSVGIIENGKVTLKQAYGVYKRENSAPITLIACSKLTPKQK